MVKCLSRWNVAHEPTDTGKPCPPDVYDVRNARSFKRFQILATTVVLNEQWAFEERAPPIHDLVLGEVF